MGAPSLPRPRAGGGPAGLVRGSPRGPGSKDAVPAEAWGSARTGRRQGRDSPLPGTVGLRSGLLRGVSGSSSSTPAGSDLLGCFRHFHPQRRGRGRRRRPPAGLPAAPRRTQPRLPFLSPFRRRWLPPAPRPRRALLPPRSPRSFPGAARASRCGGTLRTLAAGGRAAGLWSEGLVGGCGGFSRRFGVDEAVPWGPHLSPEGTSQFSLDRKLPRDHWAGWGWRGPPPRFSLKGACDLPERRAFTMGRDPRTSVGVLLPS